MGFPSTSSGCHGVYLFFRRNVTVEPVFFFFMLGSFLQYLALQQLLYNKVCLFEINDTVVCGNLSAYQDDEKIVQKVTSHWIILLNVALTVPACISTLVLGSWSDKVGRRIVMVLPTIGSILNGVCLIFSAVYMDLTIGVMVLGSVLMGLLGAYPTLTAAVFSYLGDITQERTRTKRFGLLEAMTFGGSFIGMLTCGIVIDHLGYTAVFIYYIACNAIIIPYIMFWVRESNELVQSGVIDTNRPELKTGDALQEDSIEHDVHVVAQVEEAGHQSCGQNCCNLFRLGNLIKSFVTVGRERPNRQRLQLILLLACLFLFQFVGIGENDTTVLYLKKDPLDFTSSQISYYSGLKSGLQSLTLFIAMPLLHLLGVHDCVIAVGAVCLRMGGYVMLGLARTLWQIFIVPFLLAAAGMPAATTRAMMSKIVVQSEQGSLFAMTAVLEAITGVLASLFFNALYPATLDVIGGGLVFILMAAFLVFPVILLGVIWRIQKLTMAYVEYEEDFPEDDMVNFQPGHLRLNEQTDC